MKKIILTLGITAAAAAFWLEKVNDEEYESALKELQ